MIDELDLALVDALRVDPRAPWSKLAGPLGVDQATLSRRWARLSGDGTDSFDMIQGPMAQKPSRQRWRVAGRS